MTASDMKEKRTSRCKLQINLSTRPTRLRNKRSHQDEGLQLPHESETLTAAIMTVIRANKWFTSTHLVLLVALLLHLTASTAETLISPASSSILDSLLGRQEPNPNQDLQLASQRSGGDSLFQSYTNGQAPDKVTLPGDILLGGLFPIHMKGSKAECGEINRDRGIQRLEAMLYALDKINEDSTLLPDIKLGAILLDSCSSSTYALNQSLEFIRASINTVESSAFECKDKSTPRPKYGSKMIAGVIGGSYSEVSLQVANLLRLFRIPQVSYASTGTALSDKTLYDLFARTVPSDMFQARAIADIVLKLNWTYVSLVSSEGLYGDSGSKEFMKQASVRQICIATHEKISPAIGNSSYDAIVASLHKHNATGVVLFTRAEDSRALLQAVMRAKLDRNFAWVAADGWGTQEKLVEGVEDVARGAITVELQAKAIPNFDAYMKSLTPWANGRNPWFAEYWQGWFNCQLEASLLRQQRLASGAYSDSGPSQERLRRSPVSQTTGAPNGTCINSAQMETMRARPTRVKRLQSDDSSQETTRLRNFCSPNLRISESNGYRQEQKVQFVVDAVYAMAHALHKAWAYLCDAQPGVVCEALKELNGGEFYTKYLLNVSFKDLAGSEVKFDERGDGLGRYNIYNFRQVKSSGLSDSNAKSTSNDLSDSDQLEPDMSMNNQVSSSTGNASSLVSLRRRQASGALDSSGNLDEPRMGAEDRVGAPIRPTLDADTKLEPEDTSGSGSSSSSGHIYTSNAYEYSPIGRWTEDEYDLELDDIQSILGEGLIPKSYCSLPCELGQAKIMRAGDHCCWICKTCAPYEFLPDEFTCEDCGIGRWPMPNKTSCFELPQKILRWDSAFSLISLTIACIGIGLTLFVSIIFIKYLDTPLVKASGRELSFILLAGIAFCHLSTFVLLSKPTTFVCGSQRFLVNFGFALMYASLLVKTNRISRIFNCARKSAKRPSFISPKSQMLITGILVAIQIFLTIVWFVLEPPGIRADSPEGKRDEVILKCRTKGKSFIISLIYNMILITTCTIYAVKTRKIPENFNESKFIGFTMYTTIVIWLAFVTMFFGTNNSYEIQINTMCVCISLSAYVTLFCLFSPKVSIILLHPDKNVRKLTMNSATYKRPFKAASSVASNDGRQNPTPTGGVLQDAPSGYLGGPISTTSNPNNPADSARMQEFSVVSNVINSNSGGSNYSQSGAKNPMSSSNLALVGICQNCGAQQLARAPNKPVNPANSLTGQPVIEPKSSRHQLDTGLGQSHGQQQLVSSKLSAPSQTNLSSSYQHNSSTRSTHLSPRCNSQSSSRHTNSLTATTGAKILHSKIVNPSDLQVGGGERRNQRVQRMASDDHLLQLERRNRINECQQQNSNLSSCSNYDKWAPEKRHLASLSRLNEMNVSTTSSDRGQGIDESYSSLANDSLQLNTSLENTPTCGLHAKSRRDSRAGHENYVTGKGSDSMLCNQSVHSIDLCSECCPSYCQCLCQLCSSSNEQPSAALDESSGYFCVHAPSSGAPLAGGSRQVNQSTDWPTEYVYDAACDSFMMQDDLCSSEPVIVAKIRRRRSAEVTGGERVFVSSMGSSGRMAQAEASQTKRLMGDPSTAKTRRRSQTMEMRPLLPATDTDSRLVDQGDDLAASSKKAIQRIPEKPLASSAVYSLQAAAASTLGACATTQVRSMQQRNQANITSQQMPSEHKHTDKSAIVTTSPAYVSASQSAVDQIRSSSHSNVRHAAKRSGGTIQASIELVKSAGNQMRQQLEQQQQQQQREGGCFSYHDDYEYSYGLVQSDNENCRYYYQDDHQSTSNDENDNQDTRHPRQATHQGKPNSGANQRHRRAKDATNATRDELDGKLDVYNDDDDDFEHDGRVTLSRQTKHQRQRQMDSPSSRLNNSNTRHQKSFASSAASSSSPSGSRRMASRSRIDEGEHRINSVALITATLSAGGAIVDSSGEPPASTSSATSSSKQITGEANSSKSDNKRQTKQQSEAVNDEQMTFVTSL